MTSGDLSEEFEAALDAALAAPGHRPRHDSDACPSARRVPMLVIDEYLALRVIGGAWPDELPDDELGLPMTRHWRLLQHVYSPGAGQLSQRLAALPASDLDAIRFPHPEVLQVLDPRPLLNSAADISARYAAGGLLVAETRPPGLHMAVSCGSEPPATSVTC